jgi:hypothetical protein
MIFDKKLNGFRIVPIHRHFYFEKQKTQIPKQAAPKLLKQPGEGPVKARAGPKKSAKTFLKNMIKSHNKGFVGGTKQETQVKKKPG